MSSECIISCLFEFLVIIDQVNSRSTSSEFMTGVCDGEFGRWLGLMRDAAAFVATANGQNDASPNKCTCRKLLRATNQKPHLSRSAVG